MTGSVQPDAAMSNKFKLNIVGLPPIYFNRIGEVTTELVVAEMADGTWQSTGKIKPGECEVEQYLHHETERVAMEAWFAACASGAPLHKLPATVEFQGADGKPRAIYLWDGVINRGRKTPELDAKSEGEGLRLTWMLAIDIVVPV